MKKIVVVACVCTVVVALFISATSASSTDENTETYRLKACIERASAALSQGNKESCLDAIYEGNELLLRSEEISLQSEMQFKIVSEDLLAQIATGY